MAAFVFSAANKVLQELGDLAYEEVRIAYGVKTELEKLRSTMGTVQLVLKDAEKKQASDENIRHWLKQLKDIFYDIEDVVDEFAAETLRAQVVNQESITQKVRHFFSASNPLAFRFRMSHRIKDVREKLDEIAAQKVRFHELVEQGIDDKSLMHKERYRDTTYSYVQTSNVIGRDEDRKKIRKTLIGFNNLTARNVSVVPIVGIGGLGKTSLTKLVYNDEQVVKHFPCRMWVCVSQNFVVSNVLKDMIKSATGEDCDKFNMEQLHKCLRDALLGKRFILVLDDVWSDDRQTWMDLMGLLEVGDSGSKVIVTTRSPQVANVMGGTNNVSTHDLKGLSPKESMSLFVQWAFGDPKAAKRHPELLEIGDEIVTKCKGVPLAVRTVGSLLYSKRDKRDWLLIKNNGIWELEQSENDILPALRLSYDEMPSHLKRCFVYCSIFPKRFEFDSEDLIQFWMAHNLIRSPNKDQDLEDVGEQYVKELWMRSFFEDFRDREFELPNGQQVPKCLSMLRNVRTITFPEVDILFQSLDNQSFVDACIPRFKYLRFLDLSNSSFEVLPSSISKLIHLRYFDISVNQRIEKLPKAVSKLQSLQTFRFSGCSELVKLPDGMRNLISLRHLTLTTQEEHLTDSGVGNITSLRSLVLAACENLENLSICTS
ncbi:putative disease resistance protein RGA1 isoform X3 [Carica papaya]|uniref:putative disease resistance protein RGA1 isoform X3 n=1 Tax=Carica papaya TaxID=3649 RepID=UPI000B8CF988|nr:putative disease resistance protein RGA1 isoform X3 [Carica papaya]